MSARKYIRIALSQDDEAALFEAKAAAEAQTGIAMSESMFVLSVLRRSLRDWPKQPN
jgi:hypothetical protein